MQKVMGNSETTYELKDARREDLEKLAALYRVCREDTDTKLVPDYFRAFPPDWAEAIWQYHFDNPDYYKARVLWDGEKPIGFCCVGYMDGEYDECLAGVSLPGNCGELHQIYLLPEYQKRGLGKVLYDAALEDLREMGFGHFIICTYTENENAKDFYKRMGAVSLADRKLYVVRADSEWDRAVSFLIQPVMPGPAFSHVPKLAL
jgi:GNAT superfamily N-acetyltransferase